MINRTDDPNENARKWGNHPEDNDKMSITQARLEHASPLHPPPHLTPPAIEF